jgi:hypothetical protein
MSGSSGGSSFGGGNPPQQQDCGSIIIRTQLASPDPEVIEDLSRGDILTITLASATGPLQAITNDGLIAGAILTTDPGLIISCINSGYHFLARVLEIDGGDCKISIYSTGR